MELHATDPSAGFQIKTKDGEVTGTLDPTAPGGQGILCNGTTFHSVVEWIKAFTQRTRITSKLLVWFKGRTIKTAEGDLPPLQSGAADALDLGDLGDLGGDAMAIDAERRKREVAAALRKAEKGLRYGPAGLDRWGRAYWLFDGVRDRVWVCGQRRPGEARVGGPDAGGADGADYGFDGQRTKDFGRMHGDAPPAAEWACYWRGDGTLQELLRVLEAGPRGRFEGPLLKALGEGLDLAAKEEDAAVKREEVEEALAALAEGGEGAEGGLKREEGAGGGAEEGYEWTELPNIGDVVWALRGEEGTRAWYPMKVVEPPAEEDAAAGSSGGEETESDEEAEADAGEWHVTVLPHPAPPPHCSPHRVLCCSLTNERTPRLRQGSAFLQRRILLEIPETGRGRSGSRAVSGRVVGWLPADVSDFVSDATSAPAPLWRAKLDDKSLTSQDLEEHEVRAAVKAALRADAARAAERAQFLSSKSMFGQSVRFLYGELFERDEVGTLSLSPSLPLPRTHAFTHTLSLSHTHPPTLTLAHSFSLVLTLARSRFLSLSHYSTLAP